MKPNDNIESVRVRNGTEIAIFAKFFNGCKSSERENFQ